MGGLDVQAEDIIDIIDGYKGKGYAISSQEELGKYIISVTMYSCLYYILIWCGSKAWGNKRKEIMLMLRDGCIIPTGLLSQASEQAKIYYNGLLQYIFV